MKHLKTFEGLFSRFTHHHTSLVEDMLKSFNEVTNIEMDSQNGPSFTFMYKGKKYLSKRIYPYTNVVKTDLSVWHDSGVWVPVDVSMKLSNMLFGKLIDKYQQETSTREVGLSAIKDYLK
jgi:hypothetical protein